MFEMIPTILYWEIFEITILLGSGVAVSPMIRAMRVNIISSIRKRGINEDKDGNGHLILLD